MTFSEVTSDELFFSWKYNKIKIIWSIIFEPQQVPVELDMKNSYFVLPKILTIRWTAVQYDDNSKPKQKKHVRVSFKGQSAVGCF